MKPKQAPEILHPKSPGVGKYSIEIADKSQFPKSPQARLNDKSARISFVDKIAKFTHKHPTLASYQLTDKLYGRLSKSPF